MKLWSQELLHIDHLNVWKNQMPWLREDDSQLELGNDNYEYII
jgi:hypothetical protein